MAAQHQDDAGPTIAGWQSWRARLALIRALPSASLWATASLVAASVLGAVSSVGFFVLTGALVGSVPSAVRSGMGSPAGHHLLGALAGMALLYGLQNSLGPLRTMLAGTLGRRVDMELRTRVMAATLSPVGVGHLEDPVELDKVSLARGVGTGQYTPGLAVEALFMNSTFYLQILLSAVLVAAFHWWLAVLLVAGTLCSRLLYMRQFFVGVRALTDRTRLLRRSNYFADLALRPEAAKETRVFGLSGWVLDRFRLHWLVAMEPLWRARDRGQRIDTLRVLPTVGVQIFAFVVLGRAALNHRVTLGQLALQIQAILGATIVFLGDYDIWLQHGVAALPAVLDLERRLQVRNRDDGIDPGGMPRRSIRFEGVRFHYPTQATEIFRGLDLEIPAGRSLAIVGVNGAGKTTLVKLLARLYEPTEGRILVDDIDLARLRPRAWQRRVAAIFQDFVHYELTAADNVAFGSPERQPSPADLDEAARLAGAASLVAALPSGWETVLSRKFEGGAELSGGQWQKMALARALYAVRSGAAILVLDEPTANLDVRAESELFERFLELTAGLTTILISHRFSTVRRADSICVLEGGRVVELGSHVDLVALGGRYAAAFRLQADRFVDD